MQFSKKISVMIKKRGVVSVIAKLLKRLLRCFILPR